MFSLTICRCILAGSKIRIKNSSFKVLLRSSKWLDSFNIFEIVLNRYFLIIEIARFISRFRWHSIGDNCLCQHLQFTNSFFCRQHISKYWIKQQIKHSDCLFSMTTFQSNKINLCGFKLSSVPFCIFLNKKQVKVLFSGKRCTNGYALRISAVQLQLYKPMHFVEFHFNFLSYMQWIVRSFFSQTIANINYRTI